MSTFALVIRRYAPFASFGGGFEGDARPGPSTSPSAKSRTSGTVLFDEKSASAFGAGSSGTSFVGLGSAVASFLGSHMSRVSTRVSSVRSIGLGRGLEFTATTAGANPMIPGAPDIDTFVDFRMMTMVPGLVEFSGTVRGDAFPNGEVFIIDSCRRALLLFDFRTSGGRTTGPLAGLPGSGAGNTLGRFSRSVALEPSGCLPLSMAPAPTVVGA